MNVVTKHLSSIAVAAMALIVSASGHAAIITYGGQSATDGSGLTSSLVPKNNVVNPASGFFIETFDSATRMLGLPDGITSSPLSSNVVIQPGNGCSINTYNILNFTTTGGGFAVQKGGTVGVAANPANDSTCFGYGPRPGGGTPATVKIDFTNVLAPGFRISYLGLYYGSIDDYNNIAFYTGVGDTLVSGTGALADGIVTGSEVREANGGPGNAGSWTAANSNVYINLFFDPNETFTAFEFRTTGIAFELDNVVVGLSRVPEPGSVLLVALGLFGVAAVSRRRSGAKNV